MADLGLKKVQDKKKGSLHLPGREHWKNQVKIQKQEQNRGSIPFFSVVLSPSNWYWQKNVSPLLKISLALIPKATDLPILFDLVISQWTNLNVIHLPVFTFYQRIHRPYKRKII